MSNVEPPPESKQLITTGDSVLADQPTKWDCLKQQTVTLTLNLNDILENGNQSLLDNCEFSVSGRMEFACKNCKTSQMASASEDLSVESNNVAFESFIWRPRKALPAQSQKPVMPEDSVQSDQPTKWDFLKQQTVTLTLNLDDILKDGNQLLLNDCQLSVSGRMAFACKNCRTSQTDSDPETDQSIEWDFLKQQTVTLTLNLNDILKDGNQPLLNDCEFSVSGRMAFTCKNCRTSQTDSDPETDQSIEWDFLKQQTVTLTLTIDDNAGDSNQVSLDVRKYTVSGQMAVSRKNCNEERSTADQASHTDLTPKEISVEDDKSASQSPGLEQQQVYGPKSQALFDLINNTNATLNETSSILLKRVQCLEKLKAELDGSSGSEKRCEDLQTRIDWEIKRATDEMTSMLNKFNPDTTTVTSSGGDNQKPPSDEENSDGWDESSGNQTRTINTSASQSSGLEQQQVYGPKSQALFDLINNTNATLNEASSILLKRVQCLEKLKAELDGSSGSDSRCEDLQTRVDWEIKRATDEITSMLKEYNPDTATVTSSGDDNQKPPSDEENSDGSQIQKFNRQINLKPGEIMPILFSFYVKGFPGIYLVTQDTNLVRLVKVIKKSLKITYAQADALYGVLTMKKNALCAGVAF